MDVHSCWSCLLRWGVSGHKELTAGARKHVQSEVYMVQSRSAINRYAESQMANLVADLGVCFEGGVPLRAIKLI